MPASRRTETLHLPDADPHSGPGTLGRTERIASVVGGSLLVHWGLRRGGLTGLAGTLAGGAIAWMGVNGRSGGDREMDRWTERAAGPEDVKETIMTAKVPPVPKENRSPKGPGDPTRPEADQTKDAGAPENLDEEGRFGNIKQNTTNQGNQQDR